MIIGVILRASLSSSFPIAANASILGVAIYMQFDLRNAIESRCMSADLTDGNMGKCNLEVAASTNFPKSLVVNSSQEILHFEKTSVGMCQCHVQNTNNLNLYS